MVALYFDHNDQCIYLEIDDEKIDRSVPYGANVIADYDKRGSLLGVELIGPPEKIAALHRSLCELANSVMDELQEERASIGLDKL